MNEGNEPTLSLDSMTGQVPRIELFTLADRAEVLNGKLYMMGGIIGYYRVGSFPGSVTLAIALAVEIPWHATNRSIPIAITFETQDGEQVARIDVPLTVGRPPLLPPGTVQHIPFAIPSLSLQVHAPGTLVAIASIDGREDRRISLNIVGAGRPTGQ